MRFSWPLTGRTEELSAIGAAVTASHLAGIVVRGSAGVGKSRTVREALRTVGSRGYEIRWAVGSASAKVLPLGAFAAWADSSFTDPLQIVRGVIDELTTTPNGGPVVVGVDDAHQLDELSAYVVHQIVQRRVAKVALTIRDDAVVPDSVHEIWTHAPFEHLDLQPLSEVETTTLLAATLGGPVDPDTVRRLWKLTRGNALYLRNIVEQEVIESRLVVHQGFWRWAGAKTMPPSLAEMIESRIGALPAQVGDVVDVVAVGEPIEMASLARITHTDAVEAADVRGLITLETVDGVVQVRLAHPLYGEVRRQRVAATRLRRLRGLVAAELAAGPNRDEMRVVVRRATLSLDSDTEPDPELLVRAAQGALWQLDLPLAERLSAAAMRCGGGADARFLRGMVLSWLDRGAEADTVLAGTDLMDDGRLLFLRVVNRTFSLADPPGAADLLAAAAQRSELSYRSCLDAARTVYLAAMGEPQRALEFSSCWNELPVVVARLTAWALTVACGDAGRSADAVEAAERGYVLPIRGYLVIADAHAGALLLSGQVAEGEAVATLLGVKSSDYPSPQLDPVFNGLLGRAALAAGRLSEAAATLGPVVELLRGSVDPVGWTYRCLLPYVTVLGVQGHAEEATAAAVVLDSHRHPGWRHLDYEYAIAKAWVSAAQGAISEAVATVLAAADVAGKQGQLAGEVVCLQAAVQFGDASRAQRLAELSSMVEGPRAAVAACFADALARHDGAALMQVCDELERIGDSIAALDAASHAAVMFRRDERRGSALTSSKRAEALARSCGGAMTPALRLATERLPLTSREREILTLAAQGLVTRAVAERLCLSVRTVEGHIYRAMGKTGVATREELIALLREELDGP